MPFTLQYDFAVVGLGAVDRALAGIERRMAVHNARITRATGGAGAAAAAKSPARVAAASSAVADRTAARAAAAEARHAEKLFRYKTQLQNRYFAQEQRQREKAERNAIAHAKREAAARKRFSHATVGKLGRSAAGVVSGVGSMAGAALGIGGGFALAGAVQSQMSEQAKASALANQAGKPEMKRQILRESQQVQGFTGSEVMAGMSEFVSKTGDLDTARQIMGNLGQLSLATGADLSDLGATAGQAFNVLKDQISDPVERVKELNSLMGVLAQQGAMGAVEISDLARDFGKLGAATRGFEGTAPDLLRTMGAFAQVAVARGGAEGSADASTAASRLVNDIVVNRKKFKRFGVDIKSKDDPTKLRDPMEIIADVLDKTKGDVTKTAGMFGAESRKIFAGLSPVYAEAEKKEKGSGRAAIMAEIEKYTGATMSEADLKERAKSRLDDPDLKFKEALKAFNVAIGERLLPKLTELIPKFEQLIPLIGKIVDGGIKLAGWFAENPFRGIGAVVLGKVTADLAMAKIGEGVSRALLALIGGAPVPGGVGGIGGAGGAGVVAAGVAGKGGKGVAGKLVRGAGMLGVAGAVVAGADIVSSVAQGYTKASGGKGYQMNPFADNEGEYSFGSVAKGVLESPVSPTGIPKMIYDAATGDAENNTVVRQALGGIDLLTTGFKDLFGTVKQANEELAKVKGSGVNRTDKPASPVKN